MTFSLKKNICETIKKTDDWQNSCDYEGFNFDARNDYDAKKTNLELLQQFKANLPEKPIKYILPMFHKGGCWLQKFDSIENYLQMNKEEYSNCYFNTEFDLSGATTDEIIFKIISEQMMEQLRQEEEIVNQLQFNSITRLITKEKRYKILKKQKWRCNICNCVLKMSKHSDWEGEVAHIDHIYPYSKRHTYVNGILNINELENLQALCPKCNLSKAKKQIN